MPVFEVSFNSRLVYLRNLQFKLDYPVLFLLGNTVLNLSGQGWVIKLRYLFHSPPQTRLSRLEVSLNRTLLDPTENPTGQNNTPPEKTLCFLVLHTRSVTSGTWVPNQNE